MSAQELPDKEEVLEVKQYMLYVGGAKTSFHCECGCNVFHHPEEKPTVYECNACRRWYTDA